ncbi:hypothetical protein FB382_000159 [Nocardioides ginsengisegetis]|uniref:HNH nuclease domain-containing protein n=1 Tax=Nocardioides ginsengisegetis TaxID=661491 RepID=A0A7W3P7X7_9ACTN|nr:HNH endonuclease signature motif containing protein [Nocardioides ginsengisegetis]MBA8801868.1 hypothetical protein [Nocardioides ginsengisegetis]
MSVAALRPTPISPLLAEARSLVAQGMAMPTTHVADDEIGPAITELSVIEAQLESWRLALLAEADQRDLAAREAATGTDAWAAQLTGDTREMLAGGLRLAELLRDKYAATREAFAAGKLLKAQVKVIVAAAEQAPPEATLEQLAEAEAWLVAQGTGSGTRSGRPMNPKRLRQAARRMFRQVDHDLAARHEAILLGREQRHAVRETRLELHDNGDGTYSGKFVVPELHGRLLRAALERLTAPRRLSRDAAGRPVVDESAPGTDSGWNLYEANGLAFLELLEHLPTVGHAANGVTLIVKMGLDELRSGLGVAHLDTGVTITAGEARRLACNAGIIPAVLGGDSVPLDLGRESRLHSYHQRVGLSLIHDSCAITGCERPFAWTEIHHPDPWSEGGPTDLANGLPLCFSHHQRAHDDQFDLRHHGSGDWRFHRRR